MRIASLSLALVCVLPTAAFLLPSATAEEAHENAKRLKGRIPVVAWAGCLHELAEPQKQFLVTDFGATGDDETDDTQAFKRALAAVREWLDANPGARAELFVPEGSYRVGTILFLDRTGLRFRGEGPNKTRILFQRHLKWLFRLYDSIQESNNEWVYHGGLVWVGPDPLTITPPEKVIPVAGSAPEGSLEIQVASDDAERVKALVGETIHFIWRGDEGWRSLVYGHNDSFPSNDWSKWAYIDEVGVVEWEDSNEIEAADGTCVRLRKPLRLPVEPEWRVVFGTRPGNVEDISVEDLTLVMPKHYERLKSSKQRYAHLHEPGWNGIYLKNSVNCLIDNVVTTNADIGVVLERSSHCTARRVIVAGAYEHTAHHGITLRFCSNDNLIEDFRLDSHVFHGLSVQDLAAGNVFRRGVMLHGTAECHRGMPFDNVRTDLEFIRCDGRGGGSGIGGPFAGRRMVAWNIRFREAPAGVNAKARDRWHRGAGTLVNAENFAMGAIVGVQGLEPIPYNGRAFAMPPGDKGTVVLLWGKIPRCSDLYEMQRKQR